MFVALCTMQIRTFQLLFMGNASQKTQKTNITTSFFQHHFKKQMERCQNLPVCILKDR